MAVIKQAQSSRLTKQAIILDMGDLGRQAQRILGEAREQADQILREARAESQRLIEQADGRGQEQGFARGLEEGRAEGRELGKAEALQEWRERLQTLSARWTDALTLWEAHRTAMMHEAQEDVITFAMQLAHKVVMRTIQTDRTIVRDQLAETLSMLGKAKAIEIIVHPDDRAIIETEFKSLADAAATCAHASIRDDATMLPGGCMVKTANGHVDARIETQLNRIAETIVTDAGATSKNEQSDG